MDFVEYNLIKHYFGHFNINLQQKGGGR